MAIEIEIPKDISKYEAKIIGPFTLRQAICTVPAIGIAVLAFTTLIKYIPKDICIFITIILVAPLLLCGYIKVYGMPFEKFAKMVFISIVLAPTNRKYKTVNVYETITKTTTALDAKDKKQKKKSVRKNKNKNPNLIAYK